VIEEQAAVKVTTAVGPGDEFGFVFDFGDRWEHRCRVLAEKADPRQNWGARASAQAASRDLGLGLDPS
jgi:hypothetical protein